MRALLEHSQQTYGPLPSELRAFRIRSRTSSRVSPYPAARAAKISLSSSSASPDAVPTPASSSPALNAFTAPTTLAPSVLQNRTVNSNAPHAAQSKKLDFPDVSPFLPENLTKMTNGLPRARVNSNSRRNNLGWAKRSTGKENKGHDTSAVGAGALYVHFFTPGLIYMLTTSYSPSETSFRRPRPRGRPMPTRTAPIRG